MLKLLAIITALVVPVGTMTNVVLRGTAQGCFIDQHTLVSGVNVAAFQLSSARPLDSLLSTMDTASFADDDAAAMGRFFAQYSQMVALDTTTVALARATSDAQGSFTLSVPPVDSVLIVGYEEMEDRPTFYSYARIIGQSNQSFVLDMSREGCAH